MRIALISASFPPDLGWDENATRAHEFALGLKKAGHDVEVFALIGEFEQAADTYQDGFRVHRVPVNQELVQLKLVPKTTPYALTIWSSRTALWKAFLRAHAEKPFDLVDAPNTLWDALMPGVSGLTATVIRLEEQYSAYDASTIGERSAFSLDNELTNEFAQLSLKLADKVYSSADTAIGLAKDFAYAAETIPVAVNLDRFTADGAIAYPKDYENKVIFCAKVRDSKVHEYLCSVVKAVNEKRPGTHFLVLAEDITSDDDEWHAQESVKELLGEPGRIFVTRAYRELLPELLRSAPIVVVAPRSERVPSAWFEAFACKRAVVANWEEGCDRFIKAGQNCLVVKSFGVEETVKEICDLFNDASTRARYSEAASKTAYEQASREKAIESLVALYEQASANFTSKEGSAKRALALHELIEVSERLAGSYDKMLYDLLFSESPEFRIKHWFNKVTGTKSLFGKR